MKLYFKLLELSKNVTLFWIRKEFKFHHHYMLWSLRQTWKPHFGSLIN